MVRRCTTWRRLPTAGKRFTRHLQQHSPLVPGGVVEDRFHQLGEQPAHDGARPHVKLADQVIAADGSCPAFNGLVASSTPTRARSSSSPPF